MANYFQILQCKIQTLYNNDTLSDIHRSKPKNMKGLYFMIVLLAMLCSLCTAQLNFTPFWGQGKRSVSGSSTSGSSNSNANQMGVTLEECKSTMDSIIYVYRLIQSEAQKIVECEKLSQIK